MISLLGLGPFCPNLCKRRASATNHPLGTLLLERHIPLAMLLDCQPVVPQAQLIAALAVRLYPPKMPYRIGEQYLAQAASLPSDGPRVSGTVSPALSADSRRRPAPSEGAKLGILP